MESRHSLYVIDNTCADAKQNLKMDGPVNPSAVEDGLTNYFHSEQMGTAICWSHPEEKPSFLTKGHNRSIIMISM